MGTRQPDVRAGVLGPLFVEVDGREVMLGGPRVAKVLAALLLDAGRTVPLDRLVDAMWDDGGPTTAVRQVQDAVSGLRRALAAAPGLVATRPGGYLLELPPDRLDLLAFEQARDQARQAVGDPARAVPALRRALACWRGPALAGLAGDALGTEAARLDALRVAVHKQCLDGELALGRHQDVVEELAAFHAEHPLDERVAELRLLALYRCGRRGEALEVYHRVRRLLADELGVDPSPALQAAHQGVLDGDPALARVPAPRAVPVADAVIPRQLRPALRDFTGRQVLVARLREALADRDERGGAATVAVLAGAGGAGKTSLALHVAHQAAERFPDGQLQVDLRGFGGAPAEPGEVLARFLRGLGVPQQRIPQDVEERESLYQSTLAGRRILVLLDNARDAAQVRPLLPASGGCAVLVTSRSTLPGLDGARRFTVGVLAEEEAARLFGRIVEPALVAAEPEAVAEVLRLCAGLPLAIRIAASRLACQPGWKVATLAARLRGQDHRLDELRVEDRAVRGCFAVGYDALDPAEARAFALLSAWSGPDVTPDSAAAMLQVPLAGARRLLEALARTHLVEARGEERYSYHDLVRVYAEECAREFFAAERTPAAARLAAWYAHATDHAAKLLQRERTLLCRPETGPCPGGLPGFTDRATALTWYQDERANLTEAVLLSAQGEPTPVTWRLAMAMHIFAVQSGNWQSIRSVNLVGLASARRLGDALGQAWMLLGLSISYIGFGDLVLAERRAREALAQAELSGDRTAHTSTMSHVGLVMHHLKRYEEAAHWHGLAVADGRMADKPGLHAATLNNRGFAFHALERYEEAADCYDAALAILQSSPDPIPYVEAGVLDSLAQTRQRLGRTTEAALAFRQAATLRAGLRDLDGQAATLDRLGDLHATGGRPAAAHAVWTEALTALTGRDNPLAAVLEAKLADLTAHR
ncbi:AfsR/SARP family transcriptional regulator [Streptacidiphilus jiangxiensis]|uniref:DNA-binding transcriptional activator of the SARP family n=1 Tax=Streptacidiphilus jiangxiensis TaxID=235985 RepID=A0A1H7LWC9_STRJI|nr:AfsR/SARP family transcriptional regulator [Streptacidiphilus jiangxiensis]SEL03241.1 DNA-binding transcriptional activator of the SARP family [Streptacidiphilus jiangxiensis]